MKKKTRSKLLKELDRVFSIFIRQKYADETGHCRCYTCGTRVFWKRKGFTDKDKEKGAQNGHFISRSNYKYRRDENNCRVQCYACNIIRSGNYKVYTLKMIEEYGKEAIEAMIEDKELTKIRTFELEEKIEHYKSLIHD